MAGEAGGRPISGPGSSSSANRFAAPFARTEGFAGSRRMAAGAAPRTDRALTPSPLPHAPRPITGLTRAYVTEPAAPLPEPDEALSSLNTWAE